MDAITCQIIYYLLLQELKQDKYNKVEITHLELYSTCQLKKSKKNSSHRFTSNLAENELDKIRKHRLIQNDI